MEQQISTFLLGVVTNVMNITVDESAGPDTLVGPDGLDLDSLALLELMSAAEDEYGIKVDDEDYERLATSSVGGLATYIAELRSAKIT